MKKYLLIPLTALLLVAGLSAPAFASVTGSKTSDDTAVTMSATVTKMPGFRGFQDMSVTLDCKENYYGIPPIAGWDDPAVDGHGLTIKDGDGNILYILNDASSNVTVSDGGGICRRTISLGAITFPDAHIIKINWPFTEQLNHQHDFDDNLHLEFTNAA